MSFRRSAGAVAGELGLAVAWAVVAGTFFGPYGLDLYGSGGGCGVTSIERTAYPRFLPACTGFVH